MITKVKTIKMIPKNRFNKIGLSDGDYIYQDKRGTCYPKESIEGYPYDLGKSTLALEIYKELRKKLIKQCERK